MYDSGDRRHDVRLGSPQQIVQQIEGTLLMPALQGVYGGAPMVLEGQHVRVKGP
jgi:hypothetical protein